MIKNVVIVILIIILIVLSISYVCLASNMIEYEKQRLEFILNKEQEINKREIKVQGLENCNDVLKKYKSVIDKIVSSVEEIK